MFENYDMAEDFIREYPKALSKEFCRGMIDYFEWCKQNNKKIGRAHV